MSKSTKFSDRGEAKYFYGREDILHMFQETLKEAIEKDGGTILVIQAPPGAGKTALLCECKRLAHWWQVADIKRSALWNPNVMRKAIGLAPETRKVGGTATGGWDHGVKAVGTRETVTDSSPRTTLDILKAEEKPLLLVLDEAQKLGAVDRLSPDAREALEDTLDDIHNGNLGKPVVLLAAGLGLTTRALEALEISRIEGDSLVELGGLTRSEEMAVMQDWLRKEGKAKGDVTPWINRIMRETHGWPQHIMAYMKPATRYLLAHEGKITPAGLDHVLSEGETNKNRYYEARAKGLGPEHRKSIAKIFLNTPGEPGLSEKTIKESLAREYGEHEADVVFYRALRKGVFFERKECFSIPIPSMWHWFQENFLP